jgi:hypothetical protein
LQILANHTLFHTLFSNAAVKSNPLPQSPNQVAHYQQDPMTTIPELGQIPTARYGT